MRCGLADVPESRGRRISVGGDDESGAKEALFGLPLGIAVDREGCLFVTEFRLSRGNHTIRKVLADGSVRTIGGLPGSSGFDPGIGMKARFTNPIGVAVTELGLVCVTDQNNRISRGVPVFP